MPITVEEVVAAYIKTRDEIDERTAALKKELEELNKTQELREQWLTQQLDTAKVNSMSSSVGTAFFKRNEWVKVKDLRTFVKGTILRPVANHISTLTGVSSGDIMDIIESAFPFEFLTNNVSKEPVLSLMGAKETKEDGTESRPNPAPAGIDYGSKRVLQVNRK